MPFSDTQGKDVISSWLKEIDPDYILDVGPGCGTYGKMIRDLNLPRRFGKLDAVEVWGPYVKKFHLGEIYNNVHIADVTLLSSEFFQNYDTIIFGDVIEHMAYNRFQDLAVTITSHPFAKCQNLIFSFPVLHLEQGDYEGNWFEAHVNHWSYEEFLHFATAMRWQIHASGHGDVLAWFWIKP